jgi:hypothetical protein
MASLPVVMNRALIKDFTWALLRRQREWDVTRGFVSSAEYLMKDAVLSGACINLDTFTRKPGTL